MYRLKLFVKRRVKICLRCPPKSFSQLPPEKKILALEMFSVSANTYLITSADLTKLPWKLLKLDWHEFLSKNKESGWKQNYFSLYVHSRYIVYYRYMNDFLWSKLESIFLGKASSRFRIVQKIEARTTDPQWRLNPTKPTCFGLKLAATCG